MRAKNGQGPEESLTSWLKGQPVPDFAFSPAELVALVNKPSEPLIEALVECAACALDDVGFWANGPDAVVHSSVALWAGAALLLEQGREHKAAQKLLEVDVPPSLATEALVTRVALSLRKGHPAESSLVAAKCPWARLATFDLDLSKNKGGTVGEWLVKHLEGSCRPNDFPLRALLLEPLLERRQSFHLDALGEIAPILAILAEAGRDRHLIDLYECYSGALEGAGELPHADAVRVLGSLDQETAFQAAQFFLPLAHFSPDALRGANRLDRQLVRSADEIRQRLELFE